jgi:bifunctional UDP-N-acetylglucosamine pyrophosphorylase/glucosamine-1-phosphate N-acetyltransferase
VSPGPVRSSANPRTVVILAAGEGKRMKSKTPKVLHPLLGRTLLGHVLAAAAGGLGVPAGPGGAGEPGPAGRDGAGEPGTGGPGAHEPGNTLVVVGNGADRVVAHLAEIAPRAVPVLQAEQRGTGHAVRVAMEQLDDPTGTVVVLNGDLPMIRPETVRELVETHERTGATATVLTAEVSDPTGLGRIVRGADGSVERIVEHRDATPEQRGIREINAGAYVFEAHTLREALNKLSVDNDQGEEYLTDVVALLVASAQPVAAHRAADPVETLGCNDRAELAVLRALLRDRVNVAWMRAGVTVVDPATTWIDVTVTLEPDTTVEPNTHLRGTTTVGEGATVGPDTTLVDTVVEPDATVTRAHAVGARIGPGALVGPYAYLRPGAALARKAKVGTFVEVKNAEIGEGAKVPHLSYVGDATIGEGSNIGAATVFANYDGIAKHRSTIGRHARTGVDNMFVAPVTVGDGAYTAAGSVITDDVPPGALAVARGRQHNVEGWVARRRPGTAAAEAAEQAGRRDEEHPGQPAPAPTDEGSKD